MALASDWLNLRPWNGSQQEAFEELCSQIIMHKKPVDNATFTRVGAPDAGVEGFWRLPSGKLSAYQAKFFSELNDSQWKQLDESVQTAIDKRPDLSIYTIAIPLNRPDAKVTGQTSLLEKWNLRVEKWVKYAKDKGRNVSFDYYGGSEILEELTKEFHSGRFYFWFNKEVLGTAWFKKKTKDAIRVADERYSPEIHVPINIEQVFECLGRTEKAFKSVKQKFRPIADALRHSESTSVCSKQFDALLTQILFKVDAIDFKQQQMLDFSTSRQDIERAISDLDVCLKEEIAQQKSESDTGSLNNSPRKPDAIIRLEKLQSVLTELHDFTQTVEAQLLQNPFLQVVGPAGNGKTHLFCHVAKKRTEKGLPTILLLGEQFNAEEPWSQMIKLLGLRCQSSEEFLGALQAAGEATNSRTLIMLDALNETAEDNFWTTHLPRMMSELENYPMIGLAISIRDTFEDDVVPRDRAWKRKFSRLFHSGFAGIEELATSRIFSTYGIAPSIPPLSPEFSNPQFVKILCQTLKNRGDVNQLGGYQGIFATFEEYISSINAKLSKKNKLDFDSSQNLVQLAVIAIVKKMAAKNQMWLDYNEARSLVDELLPSRSFSKSLFFGLINERLLSDDKRQRDNIKIVRFPYQRLSEFLIARELLAANFDDKAPEEPFKSGGSLSAYVVDENWMWRGVLDAFSVLLPDRHGMELFELLPSELKSAEHIVSSFVTSLIWRNGDNISDSTLDYINGEVFSAGYFSHFFEAVIQICGRSNHKLNARRLHQSLLRMSLPTRDYLWSTFLHHQYEEQSVAVRVVDWALGCASEKISENDIELYAITLAWFFTTSNRFLRDSATKALVNLLIPHPLVWIRIIEEFQTCNDPYVLERIFAVGNGIALRSLDAEAIIKMAEWTCSNFFKDSKPAPHFLMRDYARGIVEKGQQLGFASKVQITPPFKTDFQETAFTKSKIADEFLNDKNHSYNRIWYSLTEDDFAHYVAFSNFPWSGKRLDGTYWIDRKKIAAEFFKNLTVRQAAAFHEYQLAIKEESKTKKLDDFINFSQDANLKSHFKMKFFQRSLGKQKREIFDSYVYPDLYGMRQEQFPFDIDFAKRWMFTKVIELGWTPKLFADFDKYVSSSSSYRTASKAERIGKKYQWISLHTLLAHLSDQFELKENTLKIANDKSPPPCPSQLFRRDIDPSMLLTDVAKENSSYRSWWSNYEPELKAADAPTLIAWCHAADDLPDLKDLLKVVHPTDDTEWLVLFGYFDWRSPERLVSSKKNGEKNLFFMANSLLVSESNSQKLYNWAVKQDFFGRWLPEPAQFHQVFMGEYPWSSTFEWYDDPYYHRDGWTLPKNDYREKAKRVPVSVLIPSDEYSWEARGFDCSINETIRIRVPCKWLIEQMQLRWDGHSGFIDSDNRLVCFDPSVDEPGPSYLLFNKKLLDEFCKQNKISILWTIYGEKLGWLDQHTVANERLHISGAFRLSNGTLSGKISSQPILWNTI